MKKNDYLEPVVEVMDVEEETMLALSGDGETIVGGNELPGEGPDE